MGLYVVHVGRRQARGLQRFAQQLLLGGAVGHRQATARPIMVHRRAADDGEDAVLVPLRIREPLEHQDAAPLAAPITIGGRVEGLRAPIRSQRPHLGQDDVVVRTEDQVHAAGERQRALSLAQGLASEVGGDERRGARRRDDHGGALQAQDIGDAPRREAQLVPGPHVRQIPGLDRVEGNTPVVAAQEADVDAGVTSRQRAWSDPGVLQGLPGHLEHQALLRIDVVRLARRQPEELAVEAGDGLREEPSLAHDHLPAGVGILRVVRLRVPAVRGDRAHCIDSRVQEPPVRPGIVGPAGEPAAHADDGDRLRARPLQSIDARAESLDRQCRPLQGRHRLQRGRILLVGHSFYLSRLHRS